MASSSSSSSSTLIHFLILSSIFLPNFCSAHHNRRILALKNPSTLQSDSDTSSVPSSEGDAKLSTPPVINFEEPTPFMPSPTVQQQDPHSANVTPSFFPLPGLPSLPRFPPFPFIPTLPFGPGFDTVPADTIPPPPPPPPMTTTEP